MGFLLLMMLGVGVAASLLMSSEDDDGATADENSPSEEPEDRNIVLEAGAQNPSGGAGNDKFTGIVEGTVRGAAGNDTFSFENGYAANIYGGTGEDSFVGGMGDSFTLHGDAGNDSFSFDTDVFEGAVAYGGTGDDRFDLHFDDSDNQRGAILTGGDGADTYDLTFAPGMAAKAGPGKLVTITDFDPAEDRLDIDFNQLDRAELVENREGNYSDLNLHYTATDDTGAAVDHYMRIRLQGVTGATLEDLGITLPDIDTDTGRLYEIASGGLSRVDAGAGNDTIRGTADGSFFGDGGNDVFEIETGADSTLDGGSGNDAMSIGEGMNLTVSGGAGDDDFDVSGAVINLRGGEGNDTVSGDLLTSSVHGDGGDDLLRIAAGPSDPVYVYGGDGTDTLDGSGSFNIVLEGGTGDDLIVTDGAGSFGTGYALIARGGDGDDTFSHSVDVLPPLVFPYDQPARLTGGAGADAFNLFLTIGEGNFVPSVDDPEVFSTPAGLIEDFERGTDSLTIDLSEIADAYSAVSAKMIENADNGTTDIILGLADNTNPPNDIVIRVAATGLTWNDVAFTGRDPTFLNAA